MEWKRMIIITLVCVFFCKYQISFGKEVKIRVKPGDNVTLYCDCIIPVGFHIVWIRNESYGNQTSLSVSADDMFVKRFPRFSFAHNSSSNSFDLHIVNISVYDEGIYYCAKAEKKLTDVNGILESTFEYQYGSRTTHLTVLDLISDCTESPNSTTAPPLNVIEWTLLVSVCPVCVLLCVICILCLCRRKKNKDSKAGTQTDNRPEKGDEVYYASLNATSMQQKQLRNKRLPGSDFSTYAEVRFKRYDC